MFCPEGTLLRWILLPLRSNLSIGGGACLVLYKGGGALMDKRLLSLWRLLNFPGGEDIIAVVQP